MIGSLINVALGGHAYTGSKCGDSDPGACSRRAFDIGSPRTESLNSSNIVGSNTPLGWGNPFSRLGSIGDIGDTLNKLPGFSVTVAWAFIWFLDGNENKVDISIVGTNGKFPVPSLGLVCD